MPDAGEAYAKLGLAEGAGKAEIEKRYYILLKRYKASKIEGDTGGLDTSVSFEEITDAYNLLMGYTVGNEEPVSPRRPNPILKKLGINEKKAANFLHYYKFHIIIGIIVIIAMGATIKGCVTRVEPDLNLAFIGEFVYDETDALEQNVKKVLPEVNKLGVDGAVISDKIKGEETYAMQMKATVLVAAGDIDVYVLDQSTFEIYGKQGAFESLDDLAKKLKIDGDKSKSLVLTPINEAEEHIFGFDASSSPVFKDTGIKGDKKIIALGVRAKHPDKATKLIEILASGH